MEEEIEILKSIYADDITRVDLNENPHLEIILYPPDSDESVDKKMLKLNLKVQFPLEYPNRVPEFEIKNSRGISDDDLARIDKEIKQIAKRSIGTQMLFEIFQYVKDHLADNGIVPQGCICAICLHEFNKLEKFIRLECYHYFHVNCVSRYLEFTQIEIDREREDALRHKIMLKERRVGCPVCREPLKKDEFDLLNKSNVKNHRITNGYDDLDASNTLISSKTRDLQRKMRDLFEKQRINGGIIDTSERKEEIIVLSHPTTNNHQQAPNIEATT